MNEQPSTLRRQIGLPGAVMLGLGSILGAGVFVTLGVAGAAAGTMLPLAILIAGSVAVCNGLSSAQLAARHPVSGGTYEYGYRWLSPRLGFVAGWMFLLAKSASAATAALGFAGYAMKLLNISFPPVPVACAAAAIVTLVVLGGIRRSNAANMVIVSITLLALLAFVVGCFGQVEAANLRPVFPEDTAQVPGLLEACALAFVAYTGYGRVATLGEEVHAPERTIPRAVVATLAASMAIYLAVAVVALGAAGAEGYSESAISTAAPLQEIAAQNPWGLSYVVAIGAVTAMLGVLLNLILGLSRVLFAMARRGDMPRVFAFLSQDSSPQSAILGIGILVAGLTLLGDVKLTWSFSAFTVLVYYSLTNLCAIRLTPDERLFPVWPAYLGLAACASLAFWVDWQAWTFGAALLGVGLILRELFQKKRVEQP